MPRGTTSAVFEREDDDEDENERRSAFSKQGVRESPDTASVYFLTSGAEEGWYSVQVLRERDVLWEAELGLEFTLPCS